MRAIECYEERVVPANRFPFRASAPDPRTGSRNADVRLLHRPDTSSTPYQTAENRAPLAVRADESLRAIHRRAWYFLLSGFDLSWVANDKSVSEQRGPHDAICRSEQHVVRSEEVTLTVVQRLANGRAGDK